MIYSSDASICAQCANGTVCGCCIHRSSGGREVRDLRVRHEINLNRYAVKGKRLVAAEIELCGFNNNTSTNMQAMLSVLGAWKASGVGDGSLPSGGVELNTHPAAGDRWHAQIEDIMRAAHTAGVWVNNSAGCHIHVDCRDLGYLELAKVVRLLACVEPALYSIIPYFRTDNHYCSFWALNYLRALQAAEGAMTPVTTERKVVLTYRKEILNAIYGFSSKRQVDQAKSGKGHGSRYRGLNVHSYLYRGTLELRMPPGTIYPQNIINWGDLVAAIVDYSVAHPMVAIMKLCKDVETRAMLPAEPLYKCVWRDLSPGFIDESTKLLKVLAPTKVVTDWITERQKWAKKLTNGSSFQENS